MLELQNQRFFWTHYNLLIFHVYSIIYTTVKLMCKSIDYPESKIEISYPTTHSKSFT